MALMVLSTLLAFPSLNRFVTRYIESPDFRELVERQTARGLKLDSQFEPLMRSGILHASSERYEGTGGEHSIKSLAGKNITARFNPLGIFLRRWQIDWIELSYGVAELQKVEYHPDPPKPKRPWYLFLFPERIFIKRIHCDSGNVTWKYKGKRSGIYGLDIVVTPNGRDFEYQATNGRFRMQKLPPLHVTHLHTLIRKPKLYLYDAELSPEFGEGRLLIQGEAGLQEDRTISAHVDVQDMTLHPWLPESWRSHFEGTVSGIVDWESFGTKLESASAEGELRINHGRIHDHPTLEKMAKFVNKAELRNIKLDTFRLPVSLKDQVFRTRQMEIEAHGIFRLEGDISVRKRALKGTCDLGISRRYLEWLPEPEKVFPEEHGGYLWTKIHLSGTTDKPEEDLSERIKEAIFESPGTLFSFIFRQIGNWFEDAFD